MMMMMNSSTRNNDGGDDHNNDEKKCKKSKKKITPIQIALLVERYLADNKYSATLSTFRAEAAEVFSKTKGKDTPKGLLSLADILDDYVSLKEHKLILDHDRKRLDLLLHTIHDAIRLYHHPNANINGTPPPHVSPASNGNYYNNNSYDNGNGGGGGGSSSLSPPNYHQRQQQPPLLTPMTTTTPLATTTTTTTIHQRFQMGTVPPPISINANAGNNVGFSPAGHAIQSLPFAKPAIPTPLHNIRGSSNSLAPTTNPSSRKKRKMIKQLPQAPPAPKKSRAASEALVIGGIRLPSQVSAGDTSLEVAEVTPISQPTPCNQLTTKPSIEVSSVAKSLFKLPADPQVKLSSPKTPPQEYPSQSGESMLPTENSQHSQSAIVNTSEQNAVSACSVISSKKIVVISPFKQSGYYSTKKSHHISTSPLKSPLKSSPSRLGVKRDHVKSRLNFDSEVSLSSENFVEVQTTSSSNEGKIQDDIFDIELLDLEGDVSISELLLDFDLENDMNLLPKPSTSCGMDFTNRSGDDEARDGVIYLDSSSEGAKGVLSEKDMNVHSPDPIMSVKTITKCIAIASPVKNGSISPVEQVDSE